MLFLEGPQRFPLLPAPPLSAVAGIVDKRGGLRVVVACKETLGHHLTEGERIFVVPGMLVQEPVPWDEIPAVIERVQKHVVKKLAPKNLCGECMACCHTLYIKDGPFEKPSHKWCQNCSQGFGCKVYQQRPQVCRSFKCEWLKSQERNDKMHATLRPDRCGAIFTPDSENHDPLVIECHGEPDKHAWAWINDMQRVGYRVKKVTHYFGEDGKL